MGRVIRLLVPLAVLAAPRLVSAHAELTNPPARGPCLGGGNTDCKQAPCGLHDTPATVYELVVGTTNTIQFQESIEHPGHYELWLSTNGLTNFTWALDVNIPDVAMPVGTPRPYSYSLVVPPSANCNPCVMQFRQFMSNTSTYYYGCTDVKFVSVSSGTPTPTPTATPNPTPTVNPGDPDDTVHGGCVCSVADPSGRMAGALFLATMGIVGLLTARTRFHRRPH